MSRCESMCTLCRKHEFHLTKNVSLVLEILSIKKSAVYNKSPLEEVVQQAQFWENSTT